MPSARRSVVWRWLSPAMLALGACGGPFSDGGGGAGRPALGGAEGHPARVEVRRLEARPRLSLVTREGDPSPAIAVVFSTGAGSVMTAALSAVIEARVRAFEPDVRVDRDAFRLRFLVRDAARAGQILEAIGGAVRAPVAAGGPELSAAAARLASLKRNPLDAVELDPVAACTGALGIAPGTPVLDAATPGAAAALEAARRAIHPSRVAVAAVGPARFTAGVADALARSAAWREVAREAGSAPAAAPDRAADATGVYAAPGLSRRSARLTVAVRVPDPEAAAGVAERLGAPGSPLSARLGALPEEWRLTQVVGVARARGGCVSATLELSRRAVGQPLEPEAAVAAAIARREIAAEIAAGSEPVAHRQIVGAADPREAAARAAWWALAASDPGAPLRWVTALGAPPSDRMPREAAAPPGAGRLQTEIDRALSMSAGAERRLSTERGQGELWVLLASPCGVAEEGAADAGLSAVAMLAAAEAQRRPGEPAVEPWITAEGVGVVAHAPFKDDREAPAALARRVADAAARAMAAAQPAAEALSTARGAVLDHLERADGHQGAAFAALAGAIAPDHPSWVEPFGVFRRVAEAPVEAVRARAEAIAFGPLRVAVIANADAAQAAAAADAVDRWLSPAPAARTCHAGAGSPVRAGHLEVRLPDGAGLAQGLIGAAFPTAPGAGPYPFRDLAEITAAALDGPGGLLSAALGAAPATASARVFGVGRTPALVVDVRAPEASLSAAVADVRAMLVKLPAAASEGDLARAAGMVARQEQEALSDPRRRLVDLWAGRRAAASARPALAAWRGFLAATLRDAALVEVEAKP